MPKPCWTLKFGCRPHHKTPAYPSDIPATPAERLDSWTIRVLPRCFPFFSCFLFFPHFPPIFFGGLLYGAKNGGTPSYHPFVDGILSYKPSILGVPPFMETFIDKMISHPNQSFLGPLPYGNPHISTPAPGSQVKVHLPSAAPRLQRRYFAQQLAGLVEEEVGGWPGAPQTHRNP